MSLETPLTIKTTEEKRDEELVHELFKVFPKVFGKKEPRDEYFLNVLKGGDSVHISDIVQAPVVHAVTSNPEIVKRAIHRYRGFTVVNETVKQNTYQRSDSNTLIIKDLPIGLQTEQVLSIFNSDGPRPTSARSDQHNNWFVAFASEDESRQAYASSKSMTYDGKPIRVSMKRENHVRNNNYDSRPSPIRPEYNELGHLGPMSPVINPYPVYYPPMVGQFYYPVPYSPYAPVDMSMYHYYPQLPQQQAVYSYAIPSPTGGGGGSGGNFVNRRPGRGNGSNGYNNNVSYNSGRGYNGPRREKSPRGGQQFFPSDGSTATGIVEGDPVVENYPAPSATTTTQSESDIACSGVGSEETTPMPVTIDTTMETPVEVDVKSEEIDNHEKRTRNNAPVEVDGTQGRKNGNSNSNNIQKKGNTQRSNNSSSGNLNPQSNNSAQGNTNSNNRSSSKIPRDRSQNNNSGKEANDPKKEKPRAPQVKLSMEADFPILVDQKPTTSAIKSFDYANAVKKAQPAAPSPTPMVEPVVPSVINTTKEDIILHSVKTNISTVVEQAQVAPAPPVVEVDQPLSFGCFEMPAMSEPHANLSGDSNTTSNGGAKKSFIDALRQPKK